MSESNINQKQQIRILCNPRNAGAECNANNLFLGYTLRDTFGKLPQKYLVIIAIIGTKLTVGSFVWIKVDESEWTTIEHKPILTRVLDNEWKMGGKRQAHGIINRFLYLYTYI